MPTGSCFQASYFLSLKFSLPRQLFTLYPSLWLTAGKLYVYVIFSMCLPSCIPAASNADMTKVHRHCMQVSRVSPSDHRALSGNSPTSFQLWINMDVWRMQTSAWAKKRPCKSKWFFMQTYFETIRQIKKEVCLLLHFRLHLCKYGLWFT